jgi:hypothetical protein
MIEGDTISGQTGTRSWASLPLRRPVLSFYHL